MPEETTTRSTRDDILAAAAATFLAKSYHGAGLNEILRAAAVPKGSFYHHFGSKEALGVAVIEREAASVTASLEAGFADRSIPPAERLKQYYRGIGDACVAGGLVCTCPIGRLALEVTHLSEPMRAAISAGYQTWSELHEQVIREAQADGTCRTDIPSRVLADAIINAFEGAALRMQTERDIRPINDFTDTTIELLMAPPGP